MNCSRSITNARSFWIELKDIVDRISFDPLVRVIVLSSALDKFFTAGLDSEHVSSLQC
jgi:enoyl-CoA hydratase/carnithine racemase